MGTRKSWGYIEKRRNTINKKKKKLDQMKIQLKKIEDKNSSSYTNDDINSRAFLKTSIIEYQDEIFDIENNISEMDYYSNTDELLMDYYDLIEDDDHHLYEEFPELSQEKQSNEKKELDILDRLNMLSKKKSKGKRAPKRRKRNEITNNDNDILTYFGCNDEKKTDIEDEDTKNNRAELSLQYRILVDKDYIPKHGNRFTPIKTCDSCGVDKTLIQAEGIYVCRLCGEAEMIIIESERPNYKDPVPDSKPGYPYKRINHFSEWLSQFQAKENTEIPEEVYNRILNELHKNRFYNLKKLTLPYMKKILKKLGLTNYYEHTTHIISKLSGMPPPTISREIEEKLRHMLKQIQAPFEKHCPKDRINFLSYSYVLHKSCQLLELDDFVKCFPLLKSREKLRQQDKIWENICEELKWQFIPSV
jgi:hypothetical protein